MSGYIRASGLALAPVDFVAAIFDKGMARMLPIQTIKVDQPL